MSLHHLQDRPVAVTKIGTVWIATCQRCEWSEAGWTQYKAVRLALAHDVQHNVRGDKLD